MTARTAQVADERPGRAQLLAAAMDYFAEHGIGEVSLRGLAEQLGTSHRMLIYYFGSRDGLLSAIVDTVEATQQQVLRELTADPGGDSDDQALRFWHIVTDAALNWGPLVFELSAHAMQNRPHAKDLRSTLIEAWLEPLAARWTIRGLDHEAARARARLDLAVARGLLYDLLLSGDRAEVDAAATAYIRQGAPPR